MQDQPRQRSAGRSAALPPSVRLASPPEEDHPSSSSRIPTRTPPNGVPPRPLTSGGRLAIPKRPEPWEERLAAMNLAAKSKVLADATTLPTRDSAELRRAEKAHMSKDGAKDAKSNTRPRMPLATLRAARGSSMQANGGIADLHINGVSVRDRKERSMESIEALEVSAKATGENLRTNCHDERVSERDSDSEPHATRNSTTSKVDVQRRRLAKQSRLSDDQASHEGTSSENDDFDDADIEECKSDDDCSEDNEIQDQDLRMNGLHESTGQEYPDSHKGGNHTRAASTSEGEEDGTISQDDEPSSLGLATETIRTRDITAALLIPTPRTPDDSYHSVSTTGNGGIEQSTPSSHRGTLAARALLGRKRVQSAVTIQRWLRKVMQRRAEAERASVRALLRKKRQAREEEETRRAKEEQEEMERRKAAKELAEERARLHKDEEIERARQRLSRRVAATSTQMNSPPKPAVKSSKVNQQQEQQQKELNSRQHNQDEEETLAKLSDALRVSAERSMDLAMAHSCADEDDDEVVVMGADDDAEAGVCHDSSFSGRALSPIPKIPSPAHNTHNMRTDNTKFGDQEKESARHAASPDPTNRAYASPKKSFLSADSTNERKPSPTSKRSLLLSPSHVQQRAPSPSKENTERLDSAAKELQSSILSFLDAVEADASVPSGHTSAMCSPNSASHQRTAILSERSTMPSSSPNLSAMRSHNHSHTSFLHAASPSFALSPSVPGLPHNGASKPTGGIAHQVYGEVKAKMASMRVDLQQKERTIQDLVAALKVHQDKQNTLIEEHQKELKTQLAVQRAEYENQAKRQLEFVDQLVNDKAVLNTRCEQLAEEFKLLDKRMQEKQAEAEERQQRELKKQRESILTAEKIRRDNWMQEKSKEIKEMTVKGLQPEIERLLAKHKAELRRMEEVNQDELRRQRDTLSEAHERSFNELRERMLSERERAVERERELASVRMREHSERFDQQLQAQRVRLASDMAQERERLEAAHRSERQRIEEMYGMQVMDDSRKLASLQREWADREEDIRRQHAAEISRMREQMDIEKDEWKVLITAKLEKEYKEMESGIAAALEKQRDEEIELVIMRLDDEREQMKGALREESDDRIARAAEQYQAQVREAKEAEREIMDKYLALFKQHSTADERLRASSERILELEEELSRKSQALQKAEHECARITQEMSRKIDAVRTDCDHRLQQSSSEARRMQEEFHRMEADLKDVSRRHDRESSEVKKRHLEELDAINGRVRHTVQAKDRSIQALQQQVAEAEARVLQYEELLDRQRQELLS